MVIVPAMSESHAGSLALIGSELAFDFTNTSSGRGFPTHQEHLRSAENVVDWAQHAKLMGPEDAEWLRAAVSADQGLAGRMLRRALELRETIFAIAVEIAAGRSAPKPQVDTLTQMHAACIACAKLTLIEGRYFWSWTPKESAVEAVLGPIVLSALAVLTQADLSRVKQCQGDKCGWLFFDTTKNKSRRWCEMEVCGNRAKQRRHSARMHGA
jgi:predicted RNA-binding Zn ribbon-like protein